MNDYITDNGLSAFLKNNPEPTVTRKPNEDDTPRLPNVPIDPYDELHAYLKERDLLFKPELQGGKDATVAREFRQFMEAGKTSEDFYRESETYLYHGVHLEGDIWQQPYRWILREVLPPPRTLLDFGCGVGGNGLHFAAHGYDVAFADFETNCTDFLKWRLALRGWQNPCYNIESEELPLHDIAIAFDVIEHTPDPFKILTQLERAGKVVAVNLLTKLEKTDPDTPQLHYHLDVPSIMEHLRTNKKIITERNLDYAWFIIYESK